MKTIAKNWLTKIINFTTGLGFYGIGLLAVALVCWFILSGGFINNIGTGFFGAFVFKNYAAIVSYVKKIRFDKN